MSIVSCLHTVKKHNTVQVRKSKLKIAPRRVIGWSGLVKNINKILFGIGGSEAGLFQRGNSDLIKHGENFF